jgi:hypothetical protein
MRKVHRVSDVADDEAIVDVRCAGHGIGDGFDGSLVLSAFDCARELDVAVVRSHVNVARVDRLLCAESVIDVLRNAMIRTPIVGWTTAALRGGWLSPGPPRRDAEIWMFVRREISPAARMHVTGPSGECGPEDHAEPSTTGSRATIPVPRPPP